MDVEANMNRKSKLLTAAVLLAVAVPALNAWVKPLLSDSPPPLPANPAKSQVALGYARPFSLETAATHYWRKEQPQYKTGYVLVLEVDPELVHPRQSAEPVLVVGQQTAERVNLGHESGRLVVIVPTGAKADGSPDLDLSKAVMFFGTPALPEQVDAAKIEKELAFAIKSGAVAPSDAAVKKAMQPKVDFADDYELRLFCSDLIAQYSPSETDLVNGLRAPRLPK